MKAGWLLHSLVLVRIGDSVLGERAGSTRGGARDVGYPIMENEVSGEDTNRRGSRRNIYVRVVLHFADRIINCSFVGLSMRVELQCV